MKAQELIDILYKNSELELGEVVITRNVIKKTEEERSLIASDFAKMFGYFEKRFWEYSRLADLEHFNGDGSLHVVISNYSECKIIGKRMVAQDVTDCDLRLGKVKEEEVVFNQPITDAV